jgi:hypothetical protein
VKSRFGRRRSDDNPAAVATPNQAHPGTAPLCRLAAVIPRRLACIFLASLTSDIGTSLHLQWSSMSERKYRLRGYQDEGPRPRGPKTEQKPAEPKAPGRQLQDASGPRTPNLMSAHEVCRCARCGNRLGLPIAADARCSRCGVDLHSCLTCVSFDSSARWECTQQALTARVTPKDVRNLCTFFDPRTTVERETGTAGPPSARQAFDDLFK